MAKIDVPFQKNVKLRVDDSTAEYTARILDADAETIILRVPAEALGDDASPERVVMTYGHANFQWEVPAIARAFYDGWWFVERPEEMDCRRFQRRRFVRIAYNTKLLAYRMPNGSALGGSPVSLQTTNFSAGGCLASAEEEIGAQGEPLMVFLSLPGAPVVPALSEVVRLQDDAAGRLKYGIHFRGLEEDTQEQVAHFVAQEIQKSLQAGKDITFQETAY